MILLNKFKFLLGLSGLAPLIALAQPAFPPVSPDVEQAVARVAKHAPVVKALLDVYPNAEVSLRRADEKEK